MKIILVCPECNSEDIEKSYPPEAAVRVSLDKLEEMQNKAIPLLHIVNYAIYTCRKCCYTTRVKED